MEKGRERARVLHQCNLNSLEMFQFNFLHTDPVDRCAFLDRFPAFEGNRFITNAINLISSFEMFLHQLNAQLFLVLRISSYVLRTHACCARRKHALIRRRNVADTSCANKTPVLHR